MASAVPSDSDERAFVLPEPHVDPDEPAQLLLDEELEAALENRRMWGLPLDRASLVEAVREVRRKDHDTGGTYWTSEEEFDDAAASEVWEQVDLALEPFEERDAGRRLAWDGHSRVYVVGVVGDIAPLRAAIADIRGEGRVRFEPRSISSADLEAFGERVMDVVDELETSGITFQLASSDPDAGVFELTLAGPDEAGGRELLRERFGERLRVVWSADGPLEPRPRAFASWSADGLTLTLHSWCDFNGEAPGPCLVTEHLDRVEVELQILTPTGATTQMGGWTPVRATVLLAAPLAQRTVVDAVGKVARPSWQDIRDQPPAVEDPPRASLLVDLIRRLPEGQRIVDEAVEVWDAPLPAALTPPLRDRLAEPAILQLVEAVLAEGNDAERRAIRISLVENPLLLGPPDAAQALRDAKGRATRNAVALTNATLTPRRT